MDDNRMATFQQLEDAFYKCNQAGNAQMDDRFKQLAHLGQRCLDGSLAATDLGSPIEVSDYDDDKRVLEQQVAINNAQHRCGSCKLDCVYLRPANPFSSDGYGSLRRIAIYIYATWALVQMVYVCFFGSLFERNYKPCQYILLLNASDTISNSSANSNSNNNRPAKCILATDIVVGQTEQQVDCRPALEGASSLKKHLGLSYLVNFNVMMEFYFVAVIGSSIALLITLPLLARQRSIRIQVLSFMVNPVAERAKLRLRLINIVRQSLSWPDIAEQLKLKAARLGLRTGGKRQQIDTERLQARQTRADFQQLILSERPHKYVLPSCYSERSRQKYLIAALLITSLVVWTSVYHIAGFAYTVFGQVHERVQVSREMAKCQRWSPQAQLLKSRIRQDDQVWQRNKQTYLTLNEPIGYHQLGHLYLMEAKSMFSQTNVWLLVSSFPNYLNFYVVVVQLLFTIYTVSIMFQTEWLEQIDRQLLCLTDMMKHVASLAEPTGNNKGQDIGRKQDDYEAKIKSVYAALTISYLNFELFRRQFRESRWLSEHFVGFIVVHVFLIVAWTYQTFAVERTDSPYKSFLLFTCSNATIVLDLVLYSAIVISKRVQRVTKSMLSCFAAATGLSMELCFVSGLWRRQLMLESDCQQYYTGSLLGFELSQRNLLTINTYLVGISIIIYRDSLAANSS